MTIVEIAVRLSGHHASAVDGVNGLQSMRQKPHGPTAEFHKPFAELGDLAVDKTRHYCRYLYTDAALIDGLCDGKPPGRKASGKHGRIRAERPNPQGQNQAAGDENIPLAPSCLGLQTPSVATGVASSHG
jgi:hypothetical protein